MPNYEWAIQIGQTASINMNDLQADANGNLIAVGQFTGNCDFDPGLGVVSATSSGVYDGYAASYNTNGDFQWMAQFAISGNGLCLSKCVTQDELGNFYIAGEFGGTCDFNPGPGTFNLTASSVMSHDYFIVKLDPLGNFIWAKHQPGSPGSTSPIPFIKYKDGHIYTSGMMSQTVDFDPGPGTFYLNSTSTDVFVCKLDSAGNFIWALNMGCDYQDYPGGIEIDDNGNVFNACGFFDVIDADPGPGTMNFSSPPNDYDFIIQKFDSNGNLIWAKQVGGDYNEIPRNMVLDVDQNLILVGMFQGPTDMDSGIDTFTLAPLNYGNYILKIDTNGNMIWAKGMGGVSSTDVADIMTDHEGNVYTTGKFYTAAYFQMDTLNNYYPASGNQDAFIHKLDSTGDFQWVRTIGGFGTDNNPENGTLDSNGNIYTSAKFSNWVDCDIGVGVDSFSTNLGDWDVYIHKISQCDTNSMVDNIIACDSITWIDGNTYSASNNSAFIIYNNVNGCDSTIYLDLTINQSPDTAVSINALSMNAMQSGAQYQWVDCDANYAPIVGETNQTFTPIQEGNYALVITNQFCSDTSFCYYMDVLSLEENYVESWYVQPNPSSEIIFIEGIEYDKQILHFQIYSLTGELLDEGHSGGQKIDISDLPVGSYLLKVSYQEYFKIFKVVKI